MKSLFDEVSIECSKSVTKKYSTSFSLGIRFLSKDLRAPIYSIYGFVRFADEIVDSFQGYNKSKLLEKFKQDTFEAIENGISLNPILNSFQDVVRKFSISYQWIEAFLESMKMDLEKLDYDSPLYQKYIYGSAEAVGLMCLHVFTEGNEAEFEKLKPSAKKLGAAFQKINFLRDVKYDNENLGRIYFPEVDLKNFTASDKLKIENDIAFDFEQALIGIKQLNPKAKSGVYLAYYYYTLLFKKIRRLPPNKILTERIRIPDYQKIVVLLKSNLKIQFNNL